MRNNDSTAGALGIVGFLLFAAGAIGAAAYRFGFAAAFMATMFIGLVVLGFAFLAAGEKDDETGA